jgi:hypothetical protein
VSTLLAAATDIGVAIEARHLCQAHVGDRIQVDYHEPFSAKPFRVTGRLYMVLGSPWWVKLWVQDSAEITDEVALTVTPDQKVTVTVRQVA